MLGTCDMYIIFNLERPGQHVMKFAEKMGYIWPLRYEIVKNTTAGQHVMKNTNTFSGWVAGGYFLR